MRNKFLIFAICFLTIIQLKAQTVSVDDQNYDALSLSELLLQDGCVDIENASYSSSQAAAYFTNNGGAFPLDEGVVIRTGNAQFSEGSYTGDNLSSQLNTNSDPFLENAVLGDIKETAFLQFDFTPFAETFSFNFILASNEYGQWQCTGSDSFALIMTNLETGQETNIAVLPNTSGQRVSVKNIRDNSFNTSCSSQNANLFSTYNVDNPASSTINLRGFTTVLNASTPVQPGTSYRARLVLVDIEDTQFDSAVFIQAESFDTSFDLGEDISLCEGSSFDINTHLDPSFYNHEWSFNGGVLNGETDSILTVNQNGEYSVEITKPNSTCILRDTVLVETISLEEPGNLTGCDNGTSVYDFNLTNIGPSDLGLNGDQYSVVYYASQADAQADIPIPQNMLDNYSSPGDETIFVRVIDQNDLLCDNIAQFDLLINESVEANQPPDIKLCVENINDPVQIDLTQNNSITLGDYDPNDFSIKFYLSQSDAQNNENAINDPENFTFSGTNTIQTIWVRITDDNGCSSTTSFMVEKNEKPKVSVLQDTIVCAAYVLPPIQFGDYYTAPGGPNGEGTQLEQGDIVNDFQTYYIFNGPDENGCTNQSSFLVKIIEKFNLPPENCGPYTLPVPPDNVGTYYTAPNGPNGSGVELPPGTVISESQTVYYYAEYEGSLCVDNPFPIEIVDQPPIDQPDDFVSCTEIVLPPLNNGNYYTEANGNGNQLSEGTAISTSQTLYIFNDNGTCTNQHAFNVIIPRDYADITTCGSYELPDILGGGYYTQADGQGQEIPDSSAITQTQTLFYYIPTTENLPCAQTEFDIDIISLPPVDTLADQLICSRDIYTLPPLNNGDYFTGPDRSGEQLNTGDEIQETQEIFINNLQADCSNETSFTVEIINFPVIPLPNNIFECSEFVLPELELGRYFTQPGATGNELFPGDSIMENQTIYIYQNSEVSASCFVENTFEIVIVNPDVGEFNDVNSCGLYILPSLDFGDYFTEVDGEGDQLNQGDTIFNDKEVYVYGVQGERFPCSDQDSIDINIIESPVLPNFEDIEKCGNYNLPVDSLPSGPEIVSGFYRGPNGQDSISLENLTPGNYTIYAYAAAIADRNCFDQNVFTVTLYPRPEIQIEDGAICINPTNGELLQPYPVETGIDTSEFTVNWFKDGQQVSSGANFTIEETGNYTVKTIKNTPEGPNDCNYRSKTITVTASEAPVVNLSTNKDFTESTYITVEIVRGSGPYEYKIDDGYFSTENTFTGVSSGIHSIQIRSLSGGCGVLTREALILHYPKFLTPNQDGINDTWNITDLIGVPEAKIYIFTRYGKLLTAIRPGGESWDGTFNGKRMPSNDYWFRAEYVKDGKQKVFKSHFTLKR